MINVLQLRCGLPELSHRVHVAVWTGGESGELTTDDGADHHTCWRSASKPFQLAAALDAMEAAGASENTPYTLRSLSDEALAIGASSHSGEPRHTALVAHLIDRFGLVLEDLQCGAEPPVHRETREALTRDNALPSALHNDCSGKHTFMLAACRARGWSTDDYLDRDHPLQERIFHRICQLVDGRPTLAIDGCGLPTPWLSLTEMARAWSILACAVQDPELDPTLARIGTAMAAEPALTSGIGRIDLALAGRATEPWIGKIGALGVFCAALPDRGIGLALKVASGDENALACAVPAVVDRIAPGALAPPSGAWPWAHVPNVVGRVVGRRVVTGLDGV